MKPILEKKNLQFAELGSFCDSLLRLVEEPYLFLLEGDLGAGKTSFVRAWVQALIDKESHANVPENLVSSPTFTLHQEYKIKEKKIHHFDLYRLRSEEELETTGFWDIFQLSESVIIEWPERANWDGLLTLKKIYRLKFEMAENSARSVKVYQIS